MAEFCLSCWNRINDSKLSDKDFVISEDYDLCEGCGEIKQTILFYEKPSLTNVLRRKLRKWLSN